MKQENHSPGFFGMGASLLLTVFLVIMLVTFSLLSLSTARCDLQNSQLLAQRKAAYYEANNQAERVLHQLKNGLEPDVPVENRDGILQYQIVATNGSVLTVNLQLQGEKYNILSWQMDP